MPLTEHEWCGMAMGIGLMRPERRLYASESTSEAGAVPCLKSPLEQSWAHSRELCSSPIFLAGIYGGEQNIIGTDADIYLQVQPQGQGMCVEHDSGSHMPI